MLLLILTVILFLVVLFLGYYEAYKLGYKEACKATYISELPDDVIREIIDLTIEYIAMTPKNTVAIKSLTEYVKYHLEKINCKYQNNKK